MKPIVTDEFIKAIPKTDLHLHLDGSLRLSTLIELARAQGVKLPSYEEAGLQETVFKSSYDSLKEYLRGFMFTTAVLQDAESIERVACELAEAVERMGLSHAVITVVNRDDLPDGGASHYRDCILAVRQRSPEVGLELLCSDLDGNLEALAALLEDLPLRVFAHNVECVPRLDSVVRDPRASFEQSLNILREARRLRPDIRIKSSIMVGLGEADEEVTQAMRMLRDVGVDMITLGQYLQPGDRHLPVDRFPAPTQFQRWDQEAREIGFEAVASGPLVRSSYRAGLLWEESCGGEPVLLGGQT